MTYILIYVVIGAVVAVATAVMQLPETQKAAGQDGSIVSSSMLDAYFFVGLAWPVSVTALLCGSISHLLNHRKNAS